MLLKYTDISLSMLECSIAEPVGAEVFWLEPDLEPIFFGLAPALFLAS